MSGRWLHDTGFAQYTYTRAVLGVQPKVPHLKHRSFLKLGEHGLAAGVFRACVARTAASPLS